MGEHFADSKDVMIAKMDMTKNEVESLHITNFPALKFFTKDTNEVGLLHLKIVAYSLTI